MTALSAQEPSEWDEDPAWSRPDPMTAAELEAGLDRVCEQDEGRPGRRTSSGTSSRSPPDELAEIREAAADELLAVEAATTGRRGPGQPGSARVFPGQSSSPAAGFGPGMPLDVLPGCAALAVAADAAAGEDGRFAGVSEAELVGVVCAWDRVEAHAAARKLAAIAELARRNPAPEDAEFTADQLAYALARVPRPGRGPGRPGPDPATPGCPAPPRRWTTGRSPGTRPRSSPAPPPCSMTPRPAPPRTRSWTGPARLTPGGLRAAIAAAVMEVAPEKAKEAAGGRGEGRAGGAVGRGLR